MRKKNERYLPVAPLLALFPPGTSVRLIAETFGISHPSVVRWRTQPDIVINEYDADRYAITLGLHPIEIWDNWLQLDNIGDIAS